MCPRFVPRERIPDTHRVSDLATLAEKGRGSGHARQTAEDLGDQARVVAHGGHRDGDRELEPGAQDSPSRSRRTRYCRAAKPTSAPRHPTADRSQTPQSPDDAVPAPRPRTRAHRAWLRPGRRGCRPRPGCAARARRVRQPRAADRDGRPEDVQDCTEGRRRAPGQTEEGFAAAVAAGQVIGTPRVIVTPAAPASYPMDPLDEARLQDDSPGQLPPPPGRMRTAFGPELTVGPEGTPPRSCSGDQRCYT